MPSSFINNCYSLRPRIEIDVPEMRFHVLFPETLACQNQVIRAMYVKYDHLSDLSASFHKPSVPKQYDAGCIFSSVCLILLLTQGIFLKTCTRQH